MCSLHEEIRTFHGSARRCMAVSKKPNLPWNVRISSHQASTFTRTLADVNDGMLRGCTIFHHPQCVVSLLSPLPTRSTLEFCLRKRESIQTLVVGTHIHDPLD